ncbi:MAG: nitroreductase family protein [Candidatus Krumholzibacteriota bacterium]|nr:nitroreductase family protein [Candidatus Krumholzibacteriota bacterium]
MNNDNIFARRSIRRYTSEPVAEERIRALLDAAMAAPSANNLKPWHFVVVTERRMLDALSEAHPYAAMLREATAAVAVIGDPGISEGYWEQDCAAATENLLVAAAGLGLGTCWLGVHPREDRVKKIGELLGVPADKKTLALVAVGHPSESKEPRTQYDAGRDHRERW